MDSTKDLSERVTVLVFKDNYAARTFQVPLSWINRFGVVLFLFALITVASLILAAKFYGVSRRADLSRVRQLEAEISDLQLALRQADGRPSQAAIPPQGEAVQSAAQPPADPLADLPSDSTPPGESRPVMPPKKPYVFAALPAEATPLPSPPPIVIGAPKVVWQGKNLDVSFNIQYQRADRGNQQGRIIILARGPETLMAYPPGVLTAGGAETLLQPTKGEYFSVSRLRPVKAQFGPMRASDQLKEVEIMLVSDGGQIILYDRLSASAAPAAPVAPKKVANESASAVPASSPSPQEAR